MPPKSEEPLVWHDLLEQRVRRGAWADQQRSTYRLAAEALKEGRHADAEELARFTIEEAVEGHEIYRDMMALIPDYLRRHGVGAEVLEEEIARLRELTALPDGRPLDAEAGWAAYKQLIEAFAEACRQGDIEGGLRLIEEARVTWRVTHDRKCDWVCGLIEIVARRLGEEHVVPVWDEAVGAMYGYYEEHYDVDKTPWPETMDRLMHITAIALRGHLSGPGRMGEVEIREEAERWAFTFDPCGSGGRTMRADPDEGHAPRMEAPFNHPVTTKEYDWAWNRKGVCLYCVHCCLISEINPIKRLGYPARVVDPPVWGSGDPAPKCTWYIYKDPALVPEEAYAEVGARKPETLGAGAVRRRHAKGQ
jgi:hypothetical protein